MVTTITLNPCIDRSVYVDEFKYGGLNRLSVIREDVGGKGINVSKVLHNLGIDTLCMGFNYRENGNLLEDELRGFGIDFDFVTAEGRLRTNIKLYDSKNTLTELNESGGNIRACNKKALMDKVQSIIPDTRILVLSGSVPPGIGDDIYKEMILLARASGVMTVLDSDKRLFQNALWEGPDIIKPNIYELESAFGVKLNTKKEIADFARGIIERGVKIVCVSLGGEGAVIVDHCKALYSPALKLEAIGLTGAGDSMIAGICAAVINKLSLEEVLKSAMAAAAGSVVKPGSLLCDRSGYEKYLNLLGHMEIIEI